MQEEIYVIFCHREKNPEKQETQNLPFILWFYIYQISLLSGRNYRDNKEISLSLFL